LEIPERLAEQLLLDIGDTKTTAGNDKES